MLGCLLTERLSVTFFNPTYDKRFAPYNQVLGSIAINTLSNVFPLNGVSVGNLSNTLFASVQIIPANYAFAIWG
jgi:hypothetical protein